MKTFIILYSVFHDNGVLDSHVFPTKEAAETYIQALPHDDEVLPSGSDLSAIICEVGSETVLAVDEWYQTESYWALPEHHPVWVQGYDAFRAAMSLRQKL